MRMYRFFSLAGAMGFALLLSSCDATTPSSLQTGKIRVSEGMVTAVLNAEKVETGRVNVLAQDVLRKGRGSVTLTVPHLAGGEAAARKQGAAYKKAFESRGVKHVSLAYVSVEDKDGTDAIIAAYSALTAAAPADCTRMPGYQGAETRDGAADYKIGCETQSVLSKMVADPSDLLGRAGTQDNDSSRVGPMTDPYRTGKKNEPMKGLSASKIGN